MRDLFPRLQQTGGGLTALLQRNVCTSVQTSVYASRSALGFLQKDLIRPFFWRGGGVGWHICADAAGYIKYLCLIFSWKPHCCSMSHDPHSLGTLNMMAAKPKNATSVPTVCVPVCIFDKLSAYPVLTHKAGAIRRWWSTYGGGRDGRKCCLGGTKSALGWGRQIQKLKLIHISFYLAVSCKDKTFK